jgi:chromosome partitioning protein
MYDIRTKMAREILGELRSHFADKMFNTIVNFNTKIKEAASFGQPICEYDPASKGHADFRTLAEEVMASDGKGQQHQMVNTLAGQLEKISQTADELLKVAKPQLKPEPKPVPRPEPKTSIAAMPISKPAVQKPTIEPQPVAQVQAAIEEKPKIEAKPIAQAQPNIEEKLKIEAQPTAQVQPSIEEKPKIGVQPSPEARLDEKLSDYYGVTQLNNAVVFVTLYPHAHEVCIAGDFNNWQPTNTKMDKVGSSGIWQTKMKLAPGKYRYRLVVDGKWQQDPYNEISELNPFGEYNSVINIK